ncbi:MAG: transglutaminase family protein [Verrucomicrobiota bacterium]
MRPVLFLSALLATFALSPPGFAAERGRSRSPRPASPATPAPAPAALSAEEISRRFSASVVVINSRGREGAGTGVGAGFVVDAAGLVASSLHVIGEARPVSVRLADGRSVEVTGIHGFDRPADLVVLRVAATNLPALQLGDSDALQPGVEVVALGHPLGLDHSVVQGVVSGLRELEGLPMLQLALPIEPGNSGGPVLDRQGRVLGIVNAKSLLTRNLGFGTPVKHLRTLLEHPNPVPMARWIRLGAVDPGQWTPRYGASWRRKGDRVVVDGAGEGFGGRSMLWRNAPAPATPFELAVTVKLDDEAGAAGLVFAGDGGDRHYGFYPTGGQLRLTAFEGADVFSWRILGTVPSAHYRAGEWNRLRVRVEADGFECFVNEQPVFRSRDAALRGARVGLAKFRETAAEFREFRVGPPTGTTPALAPELVVALGLSADPAPALGVADLAALRTNLPAARQALAGRAQALEQAAAGLRQLASQLHRDHVRDALVALFHRPEEDLDLVEASLLVAWHDLPALDVEAYRGQFEELAGELKGRLGGTSGDEARLQVLREVLFEENGFHGSRHDYENPANSHFNEVLDDREGLPITLSILFLELARRTDVRHVVNLPLPGHFLVKYDPPGGSARLIDVFDGGRFLTVDEADRMGSQAAGVPVRSEFLTPAGKRDILLRLLNNLQSFAERRQGAAASLPYQDLLVALAGSPRIEAGYRAERARLHLQLGQNSAARADLRWIVETAPSGVDLERVSEALRRLDREP